MLAPSADIAETMLSRPAFRSGRVHTPETGTRYHAASDIHASSPSARRPPLPHMPAVFANDDRVNSHRVAGIPSSASHSPEPHLRPWRTAIGDGDHRRDRAPNRSGLLADDSAKEPWRGSLEDCWGSRAVFCSGYVSGGHIRAIHVGRVRRRSRTLTPNCGDGSGSRDRMRILAMIGRVRLVRAAVGPRWRASVECRRQKRSRCFCFGR